MLPSNLFNKGISHKKELEIQVDDSDEKSEQLMFDLLGNAKLDPSIQQDLVTSIYGLKCSCVFRKNP